jgi:hypothetical protein
VNSKLDTIIPAVLGAGGIEAVEPIMHATTLPANGVISTVMQVIIGIVTLIKLFKSKKR